MVSGEPSGRRAPRIFLDDAESVNGDLIVIRGEVVRRLSRVLRMRRGDALEVIHAGRLFDTVLDRVSQEVVEATIRDSRPTRPEPDPRIVLCPALIRPQRFDFIVEKATELGVSRIRPVHATRSLAPSQSRRRVGRWRRLITEAAEQCRREERPEIDEPVELETVLRDEPPPGTVRIFASERERARRVGDVLADTPQPSHVEILVGPEGGFTESEVEIARANDWQPVTMGPRPLRSETAAIAATAVVQEALFVAAARR